MERRRVTGKQVLEYLLDCKYVSIPKEDGVYEKVPYESAYRAVRRWLNCNGIKRGKRTGNVVRKRLDEQFKNEMESGHDSIGRMIKKAATVGERFLKESEKEAEADAANDEPTVEVAENNHSDNSDAASTSSSSESDDEVMQSAFV